MERERISGEFEFRVRYCETDMMGIVHHSNYVCYAEMARAELLRKFGTTYRELEDRGTMMPVIEVNMNYFTPALYDEILTVKISTGRIPGAKVRFDHEIYNGRGELVNSGYVTLAFMSAETRRACRPPQWFVDVFKS
jgi:acyl-CoA thioester hydrolase